MAAYFTFATENVVEKHVGSNLLIACEEEVTSVQADGHELEYIKQYFTGLPMHNGRVVSWYGDHANFIAHNWNRIR